MIARKMSLLQCRINMYSALSLILVISLYLQCTTDISGGFGSETTNGVVSGSACLPDGQPSVGARVSVRRADFFAESFSQEAPDNRRNRGDVLTDTEGRFVIDSLDTGNYIVEINDGAANAVQQGCDITEEKDEVVLNETTLQPYGIVVGWVNPATLGSDAYVQCVGLDRLVSINENGNYILDDLPYGPIQIRVITDGSSTVNVVTRTVTAQSGGTTTVSPLGCNNSRKVNLNTTASGAGIYETSVTNFPVLIRLESATFDFTGAAPDGRDLTFTKSNGMPMAHEIERWDAQAESAVMWVLVDTVYANDSTQHFFMYWGNPDASDNSNSEAVFDTAAGFQGVWHLSGQSETIAYDATGNHYDGTCYNMNSGSVVPGVVGNALTFDGTASYITIPNSATGSLDMKQNGEYAISCWAYADTIDTLWHAIAGKGHEQYYLKLKCFDNEKATWEFVEFQDQLGWEFSEDSIPPAPGAKQWVCLTGVRSGEKQYFYINGVLVSDSTMLMAGEYPRVNGDDFTIGKHAREVTIPYEEGWCYFKGIIDEVRVMSFAPDSNWIRLCYMNQKAEDALVEFR